MKCNTCSGDAIKNEAGGKEFWYCRSCKEEVLEQPSYPASWDGDQIELEFNDSDDDLAPFMNFDDDDVDDILMKHYQILSKDFLTDTNLDNPPYELIQDELNQLHSEIVKRIKNE